ncbi:MAG: hypothetical protein KIT87_12340 [Anaerolineae bacterium]|nr:hypothetical protein [Anaerolineae bacterium]
MFDVFTAVLWLALIYLPGVVVKRWGMFHLHAVGVLLLGNDYRAIWLRFLVLAPGILLHEASHWLTAKLLLVPTGKFSLGPSRIVSRGRQVQVVMGSVMVGRSDAFRSSLIGAAPFFFGTLAIVLLANRGFGQAIGAVPPPPTTRIIGVFTHLSTLFQVKDAWFWLYLVFSVSNSLMPSESDRRGWFAVTMYLLVLAAVVVLVQGTLQVTPEMITWLQRGLDVLLFAFSLTLAVDIMVGVVVYILYQLISRVRGQRVYFR